MIDQIFETRLAEAGMTREEFEAKAEADYKKKHGIIDPLDEEAVVHNTREAKDQDLINALWNAGK